MLLTTSRLHGNSVMVELPKINDEQPKITKENLVVYSSDSNVSLIPSH